MKTYTLLSLPARLAALVLLAVSTAVLPAADTMTLEVFSGGSDAPPMAFEAARSDVLQIAEGYMVQGDVYLKFGEDKLPLLAASLFFQFADGSDRIERVRGTTYVPSPYVSDNVEIKKPAMAEFGMDYGVNLELGIPLNDERNYLFFRFDSGFEMEVGATGDSEDTKPLTLEIPAGVKAMLVLDPADPFFFVSGEVLSPEGDKGDSNKNDSSNSDSNNSDSNNDSDAGDADVDSNGTDAGDESDTNSDAGDADNDPDKQDEDSENEDGEDLVEEPGFGASVQGLIPFRPRTTYGLEDVVREFQGEAIVTGEFQLGALPLVVTGQIILNRDFDESATPIERAFSPVRQMGANGDIDLAYEFLKVSKLGNIAELSIPLGTATAAVEVIDELQHAYVSGVISPDTSWIPDWVPVVPEYESKAYGYVSTDLASSRIAVESLYAVDMSNLGELAGVDLQRVISVEGAMKIDQNGFLVKGATDADLGPFQFEAGASAEVFFPFADPQLAYAIITGRLMVGGVATEGVLEISQIGVTLNGRFVNDQFDVRGRMQLGSENGVEYLAGELEVPQEFNEILHGAVRNEVEQQRQATESLLDAYREATEDYEVEVSLRGVRRLIPGICDGVIKGIDSGISKAFSKWPKKWGVSVPGKSSALKSAKKQAEPTKRRFRALKAAALKSDNATFRAALKAAINDLLRNQRLKVKVAVIGTIYSRDTVSSTNEARLRKALTAIDALPAASERRVSAKQAWEAAPVNETLNEVFDAIETGVGAAPYFEALGIYHELFSGKWTLVAYLRHGGETTVMELPYDAQNPRRTAESAAAAFIPML